MACFTVPLATAAVTTATKLSLPESTKGNSFVAKLPWLEKMMFGGSLILAQLELNARQWRVAVAGIMDVNGLGIHGLRPESLLQVQHPGRKQRTVVLAAQLPIDGKLLGKLINIQSVF